jgi:glycolate oxidase FAD binding subunit
VALAGSRETVDRQVRDFRGLLEGGKALAMETLGGDREAAAWRAIRDVQARLGPGRIVAKVAVPIGRTGDLFFAAERLLKTSGLEGAVTAHAGSGVIRLGISSGGGTPLETTREALVALRREAEAVEGSLVLEAAPAALKRSLDSWGAPRGGLSVMRRLKAEFDPQALMAPGRFLSGI